MAQQSSGEAFIGPDCLVDYVVWSGRNLFCFAEERENSGTTEKTTTDELRQLLETEALQRY